MSKGRIVGVVGAVVGLIALSSATYALRETEQVIITQFGEPVGDPVVEPGLHFKIPFIQETRRFDKRWLEWDGASNQVPTRDKKYIWIDTYARWRIADPLRFFQRLRDERGAQSRLDDIVDGVARSVIANHALLEIVRTSNRKFEAGDEDLGETVQVEEAAQVEVGREKITAQILKGASERVADLGIELVDVQVKRINYIESVQKEVFKRMIAERKRIADRHRSEGQGKSAEIRGKKERELKTIESEAYRKAQEIMGKADAEAASIYAAAYNRDRDFYRFVRSLETYKQSIDEETTLLLSTQADIFEFLKSAGAK